MLDGTTPNAEARLTLKSQLSELARAQQCVDALAAVHPIPHDTVNAIQLCLEEACCNIIRHGYAGQPDQAISIEYRIDKSAGVLEFIIEDTAPHFNPLEVQEPAAPATLEEMIPGGQGIRLIRRFAASVNWQPLAQGNRLTLGFPYCAPGVDPR